jgi:HTH-type transcriptional regulator, quorum sensing regulator NprR
MIRGEKVKYYRETKKLTQRVLAEGICSISYLSKIENNSIIPTEETLKFLCEKLQIDVNELVESSSTERLEDSLSTWYEDIKFRDKLASSEHYQTLGNRLKGISDINLISQFNLMSARYFLLLGNFEEAKKLLDDVESHLRYLPDKIVCRFYYFTGLYEYLRGDLNVALAFFNKIDGKINEPEYSYQLGLIYTSLNKITMSIAHTEKALQEFNQNILFFKIIDCYILLGVNYNRIKEYELAESYYFKALKGLKSLNKVTHLKANIYHNLGCTYHSQKKSEEAIKFFFQALDESENYKGSHNTIYRLANELYIMKRIDECYLWIKKGLSLVDEKSQTYYLLKILLYQVNGLEASEEYRTLVEDDAVTYFNQKNDVINLVNCYEILAQFYYRNKSYKKSSDYYLKCCELKNNYY